MAFTTFRLHTNLTSPFTYLFRDADLFGSFLGSCLLYEGRLASLEEEDLNKSERVYTNIDFYQLVQIMALAAAQTWHHKPIKMKKKDTADVKPSRRQFCLETCCVSPHPYRISTLVSSCHHPTASSISSFYDLHFRPARTIHGLERNR